MTNDPKPARLSAEEVAELEQAARRWCVCCPSCGRSNPWTDGTDTQVWCQVCGHEFDAPDYLVAVERLLTERAASSQRVAKLRAALERATAELRKCRSRAGDGDDDTLRLGIIACEQALAEDDKSE